MVRFLETFVQLNERSVISYEDEEYHVFVSGLLCSPYVALLWS